MGKHKRYFNIMESLARVDPRIACYMLFNFVSASGIIFVNKLLFRNYKFPYATFTTSCHFVITFLGVFICKQLGFFKSKRLAHCDVLSITLFFVGFVVFNNLSLNYNSVGFYQLMKVMTTPVIAVIQYVFFGQDLHWKLKLALVPVILGVCLATVSDVQFNSTGFAFACVGILSTSYYQIFVKKKQKELDADGFQILMYQAPQAAVLTFMATPFLDPKIEMSAIQEIWAVGLTREQSTVASVLLLSCVFAFCVNLSIYLVVGATSPISYNVLGHSKLLVILTVGIVFFGDDTSNTRIAGMVLAVIGIIMYTHIKLMMPQPEKFQPVAIDEDDSLNEKDSMLVEIVNKGI